MDWANAARPDAGVEVGQGKGGVGHHHLKGRGVLFVSLYSTIALVGSTVTVTGLLLFAKNRLHAPMPSRFTVCWSPFTLTTKLPRPDRCS